MEIITNEEKGHYRGASMNTKGFIRFAFWTMFLISILVIIRHSNYPSLLPEGTITYNLLLKPKNSDGILLSLSTGYLVSALFYWMLVYVPEKMRKDKIRTVVVEELSCVCDDIIMLLALMYKSVSTEESWSSILIDDDSKFFDKDFYSRIKLFDGYCNADSLAKKVNSNGVCVAITWDEKLVVTLEDIFNQIDKIITKYIFWLEDDLIDAILAFRDNEFMAAYLGLPTNKLYTEYIGVDGKKYAERISIFKARTDSLIKKEKIFADDKNLNMLQGFVDTFLKLRKICYESPNFKKDIAITSLCIDKCGNTGTAISEV